MKLYENIRIRRKELGLTQSDLAEKMGYAGKSMISRIERGDVDLSESKIMEFARILDTTPQKLMGWDIPEEIINAYHASVDQLIEELNVIDGLKMALSKDPSLTDYNFSDDQLYEILEFARFKAGVR